jgi:putative addiction module component (TIGR02574 family)
MDKKILEEVLKMPPNERLIFAELIFASLEHENNEVRDAWLAEVDKRIDAVKEGKSTLLDFDSLYNAS